MATGYENWEKDKMIELRTINENNYTDCLNLKASVANTNFVDSVAYSLAEAWVHYKDTKPFAIYADETMIGFVSMYVGEENYQIINFLIDDAYQKKGYGTAAAKLCIDFLYKEYKARRVSAPVNQCHTAAQKFWAKLGFAYSDSVEDGYVFMRLNLV
ncbi:MAG: GNAT family N-acetyltransferase [Oscillospiraceae bacterium]